MLSTPQYGWTRFSTQTRKHALSYLTNVPFEWLDQAIHGLKTLQPFTVHGCCEPMRFLCTVSYWNCHIIREEEGSYPLSKEHTTWEILHISMLDFCKQLHDAISNDIDAWSDWYVGLRDDDRSDAAQRRINKRNLRKRLKQLKKLIQQNEEAFHGSGFFF